MLYEEWKSRYKNLKNFNTVLQRCPRFWPLAPPRGMNPRVYSLGISEGPPRYLSSKFDASVRSDCWDISIWKTLTQCDGNGNANADDQGDYNSSPCTSYRPAKNVEFSYFSMKTYVVFVCFIRALCRFQQSFSHIMTVSGYGRELTFRGLSHWNISSMLTFRVLSLKYHSSDTWHDIPPSHIILTLSWPVLIPSSTFLMLSTKQKSSQYYFLKSQPPSHEVLSRAMVLFSRNRPDYFMLYATTGSNFNELLHDTVCWHLNIWYPSYCDVTLFWWSDRS